MAENSEKGLSGGVQVSMIKVNSYENQNLSGTLLNLNLGRLENFDNLIQLIRILEELGQEISTGTSDWQTLQISNLINDQWTGGGKAIAHFRMEILFMQNHTWQGQMIWLEKKKRTQFRSTLEWIFLMDQALSDKTGKDTETRKARQTEN